MGLIKDFLKNKKEQKNANISLEEENIALRQEINKLKNQIKEIEYLHAEEISALDRDFLAWYSKQNNALNSKDSAKIGEASQETRGEQREQEALDLEAKTEDLNIEELLNE